MWRIQNDKLTFEKSGRGIDKGVAEETQTNCHFNERKGKMKMEIIRGN